MKIALVSSMFMERNYIMLEIFVALTLNVILINFYVLRHKFQENDLFFDVNSFYIMYLVIFNDQSTIHPNHQFLIVIELSSPILHLLM